MYRGTLRPPPPTNKKKIIIIASIIAAVSLSALGGLIYKFTGSRNPQAGQDDGFGPPRTREWNDSNMPNPNKQSGQEIMAYMDSADFRKLSSREQFMYMRSGGEKVMEYQIDTYFSMPDEKQKTAYLDTIIDRMQAQRANFQQTPPPDRPRRRDANEPNDPNRARFARAFNPSNMRARSESGTPEQRARQMQFRQAMQKRMQQRGIAMPGPGGPGRPGGGRGRSR